MLTFQDIAGHTAADHFGWLGAQMVDATRIAPCSTPQRSPVGALKITVQPGDNPLATLGGKNERNELLWMFNKQNNDENGNSGTQYYGLSLYLPSGWQDTRPDSVNSVAWCTPLQLHGPNDIPVSPAFQLDLCTVPGRYSLILRGGDTGKPVVTTLDLGPHAYDQWVDLLFCVTWSDKAGAAQVWKRVGGVGQLVTVISASTPTLYSQNGIILPHYWKRSCYRNSSPFTTVFYTGPLARATTFEEAAVAAFWQ